MVTCVGGTEPTSSSDFPHGVQGNWLSRMGTIFWWFPLHPLSPVNGRWRRRETLPSSPVAVGTLVWFGQGPEVIFPRYTVMVNVRGVVSSSSSRPLSKIRYSQHHRKCLLTGEHVSPLKGPIPSPASFRFAMTGLSDPFDRAMTVSIPHLSLPVWSGLSWSNDLSESPWHSVT